jgi:hypothetical protein
VLTTIASEKSLLAVGIEEILAQMRPENSPHWGLASVM